jgi:hypothetical protein
MSVEEKLQNIIGAQFVRICVLETELENLQRRIVELEQKRETDNKPSLHVAGGKD